MRIRKEVQRVEAELGEAGIDSPRLEAERLVARIVEKKRHELFTDSAADVTPDQARGLNDLVRRRTAGEPLQHLEEKAAFRDLELEVGPATLIPRPETEQLVDRIAAWVHGQRGGVPAPRALDIGTGSGAIALALASENLAGFVLGVDVSRAALDVARRNVAALGLSKEVRLRLIGPGVWDGLQPAEKFELIVSNPPYVSDAELEGLSVEVRDHEPRVALAGGPDGLDIIREISLGAPERLAPSGRLFMEIGANQGAAVRDLLASDRRWSRIEMGRDLNGRFRFAIATRS